MSIIPPRLSLAPVLSLQGLGVGFRDRVILAEVSFDVPERGVMVVMGPAGGGKSTLLRTLAGLNQAQPELRQWGSALFQGQRLDLLNRPLLVQQDLRHVVGTVRENLVSSLPDRRQLSWPEQDRRVEALLDASGVTGLNDHLDQDAAGLPEGLRRLLATLRAMATDAPLVCLDDTTAGLDPDSAARLLGVMRWYARRHAVLFGTHHQLHAKAVADTCVLLAGGRVQERAPAVEFFERPRSSVTKHFLETGGARLPSPDATPEMLAEDAPPVPPLPPAARARPSPLLGPRGFRWLLEGSLGGLPRPGITASLEEDLASLRRLDITTLVTLEETATVPTAALERAGIGAIHFPIGDMQAPETVATAALCRRVEDLIHDGGAAAFHCRAGHGRTGTLLACQLIWTGFSAVEALDRVRKVNPLWVTSAAQVRFLETFSEFVQWQGFPSASRALAPPAPARWLETP